LGELQTAVSASDRKFPVDRQALSLTHIKAGGQGVTEAARIDKDDTRRVFCPLEKDFYTG